VASSVWNRTNQHGTTVSTSDLPHERRFYPDNPLWDGQSCGQLNTCNTETSLCADGSRSDEDVVFETLELYVQYLKVTIICRYIFLQFGLKARSASTKFEY
jgi:hypothetical protein